MGQKATEALGTPVAIEKLASSLSEAMRAEETAYASMLVLVDAQRAMLEANDLQALDLVTGKQIEAVSAVARVAREREKASAALGRALGLAAEATTLRRIVAELPPPQAQALEGVGRRLHRIIERIENASERNKAMLVNGLRVSQHLLGQLLGSPQPLPVYAPDGRMSAGTDRSALEYQA